MPRSKHHRSDRTYQLDPTAPNLEQQGGTYVPTGSSSRFWSHPAPRLQESRAPDVKQKSGDNAESKPPAPAMTDGDDPLWVVVPGADAAAGDDDLDKRTIMEFNFWVGWGRWKHKLFEFKAWDNKKT